MKRIIYLTERCCAGRVAKVGAAYRGSLQLVAVVALLAGGGCGSTEVWLPASPDTWDADPVACATASEGTMITITKGGVVARGFTWGNSEIEFRLLDPAPASFAIAFYDHTFAEVRRKNADRWFEIVGGKPVPLSESGNIRHLDRVHELWLSGDQTLIEKGYRALGGRVTTEIDARGLSGKRPMVIFSENFKIGAWNHVRIRIEEGVISVWVNGKQGQSVRTDTRLNGAFGFEVSSGQLKLSHVSLRQVDEGSEPWLQGPEGTR